MNVMRNSKEFSQDKCHGNIKKCIKQSIKLTIEFSLIEICTNKLMQRSIEPWGPGLIIGYFFKYLS